MEYNEYQYLFPPRPDVKVAQGMLGFYQNKGWYGQIKKNGTCTVVFATKDQVIYKTRHNEEGTNGDNHKLWAPLPAHDAFFKSRATKGWNVWCGELMHSKVAGGPKNDLYIFDQLVHEGRQLVGTTLEFRQELLKETLGEGSLEVDKFRMHAHVSRARNFTKGFNTLFTMLGAEDEGLVLKDPKAKLSMCSTVQSNNGWQVKSRRVSRNYGF